MQGHRHCAAVRYTIAVQQWGAAMWCSSEEQQCGEALCWSLGLLPSDVCRCHLKSASAVWRLPLPSEVSLSRLTSAAAIWSPPQPSDVCRCHLKSASAVWCLPLPSEVCLSRLTSAAAIWSLPLPSKVCRRSVITPAGFTARDTQHI